MIALDLVASKTALALTAGIGYAVATLLMKLASDKVTLVVICAICVVLIAVVTAEVLLLRQIDLGMAYIAIIATETLLVLAATFLVGEPLTSRELFGGALVITGAALVAF
ncbi:5-aminolevulinate synthase [Marivita sp. S6314]|uniref:5-aminolevulinate synthase n=1 Tax=Marivita sp. S6314 TaxID=2926406 RepID=UPI001FF20375|nr:5-aminolevulinate synthase [Marivita sp. S6314]MCK0151899.1 5-aminolevulinate synthase [Marivita sp. S6314]